MTGNIFDDFLSRKTLFVDKEVLRHDFRPKKLPHRQSEIEKLTFNLVEALNGHIPSNMTLYGVTGAGKTAVTSYVCDELEAKGREINRPVQTIMVNCRQIDTQYRVLSHLGNSLLESHEIDEIPFTGWPTDRVFGELVRRMDDRGGVFVIILDEIDHLVRKAGDDLLYNLTSINASLKSARACVIGISNDLKFTDFLDPRVRSRLGQSDVVFNPYDAMQLQNILRQRAEGALVEGALDDSVIALCAAIAAQEHGDARCALDLLRVSTEKAEQSGDECVTQSHVRMAQHQLEADQMHPVLASLPSQQKLVLASILLNERNGLRNIQTGEVYAVYTQACRYVRQNPLTQRRVSGLISNLDMLGLITARTVSRGRYGRTKEINSCIPQNIDAEGIMVESESQMKEVFERPYRHQSRL
ncbi:MAG TPA: ORC1-type DNA replication protein [Candidatus Poseidoniales archaeon]|nr:cell division control protein Cdc6 [Euryarchaeota archaeon]DAC47451.1 MAG TPA: ORC1-type DNA replication protein [Candidatus Poseidoniales archaeon]HII21251.1 ORC1-type DNA replication protein [Candidatus Poseidoniaceae archaeon]|tara:strand:+ start:6571 stop:7812 length:1242 start_codon:yes stop_codon:yes gene_type:complete